MIANVTLILGGARSGKSRYAEDMIERAGLDKLYLATGQAFDNEMAERIAAHREQRGGGWETIEEATDIAARLRDICRPGRIVLVDCLTLWLSNMMLADLPVDAAVETLGTTLPELAGPVVFVSNEVGLGIVPENALARKFRDHQGRLNQRVAAAADHVVFIAAGLPLVLKTRA